MHLFRTQFLYVLISEQCSANSTRILDKSNSTDSVVLKKPSAFSHDTKLRVVFWDDSEGGYFVVYGTRPESKVTGPYSPYRLRCNTVADVVKFAKTVISSDSSVAIELHQFDALNDDSEDALNVDWENNPENGSTELVAFDFKSIYSEKGVNYIPFSGSLSRLLRQLVNAEVV